MFPSYRPSDFVRRTLALAVVLGAGAVMAGAQTSVPPASPAGTGAAPLNLQVPAIDTTSSSLFSSSNDGATDTAEVASLTRANPFVNAMQYGGRRYGRPRYRGGNTNQDGSNKYEFYLGGGLTLPTGLTHKTNTLSWSAQVGAGRNFNKNVGVNIEFDWDNFGLQGSTLRNQQNLYNGYIALYNASLPGGAANPNAISPIAGLDGYSHDWSFSLQPIYNIAVNEGLGAYITGGVGFYHKITTFTVPSVGTYCSYYYGCYQYQANTPIDSYTSNAPGVDAGIGFTYKLSRFSGERLYAEARYVYTFNQLRPGVDAASCTTTACLSATASLYNDYPRNSQRTSYVPVKFGIRF